MKRIYYIIALLVLSVGTFAQSIHTSVLKPNIHTLRMRYLENETLQRPFLTLGGDEIVEISFDELSHSAHQYTYTVLHLNADFTPSDLQSFEYLRGFTTADITDYDYSLNTQQLYTHYRLTFPNDDMQPLVSGNYAIKIYEDGDPDNVVAYQVLSIVEPQVTISGTIRSNTDIELSGRYQQLDIDVNTSALNLTDPSQVKILIQQNGRRDNAVFNPKPTYIESKRLRFINNKQLIFEGGNEFRRFDIASVYFLGYNVDRIDFDRHYYNAFLFPSENWANKPYVTEIDSHGQYVINAERTDDDDYEAEYMWVHFLLPQADVWFDGGLYISGDLTYNQLSPMNRMQYDYEHHCYYLALYLKQGGYDFQYLFRLKTLDSRLQTQAATTFRTEGSHWETQNEYTVYVYYRPFGTRYDQLICIQSL